MAKILIPVNFVTCGINACEFGVHVAHWLKAEIYLLHCYEETSEESDLKAVAEEKLENIKLRLQSIASQSGMELMDIHKIAVAGKTLDHIQSYALTLNPDLIIISTQSIGDKVKKVLGSRSYSIIRNVEIPIISLPETFEFTNKKDLKIGFVTNSDPEAMRSIHRLIGLAGKFISELTVIELCPFGVSGDGSALQKSIHLFLQQVNPETILSHHVVDEPNVKASIEELISKNDLDLISVSTQKRKFLSRLLFPGLMRSLYFNYEIPMLILHS